MTFLTPAQKRDHFRDSRTTKQLPAKLETQEELGSLEIEHACRRIRDEVLTARRLNRAYVSTLRQLPNYREDFPGVFQSLKLAAATHRRLYWYALAAATRELGILFAGTNDWSPLSHDEAGADLDPNTRRLLEWLVDVGREGKRRRAGA